MNADMFEGNKIEKQKQEASLFHASGNAVLTINVFFNMLRLNSNVHQYKEIWVVYQQCIRIIMNDFLPKQGPKFEFKAQPEFLDEKPSVQIANANFETMNVDEHPLKIVKVLYFSLKNLRKNISQIDTSQKKLLITSNQMRRTSFLAELELNYIYALHSKGFNVGAGSQFFLLMYDYIDYFYDKSDVIEDLTPYLKLLNADQDVE